MQADNADAASLIAYFGRAIRPPDRSARYLFQFDDPRARRHPNAVQDRQNDANGDAFLDGQHDNRRHGADYQGEFGRAPFPDVGDVGDSGDSPGDKHEKTRERGVGEVSDGVAAIERNDEGERCGNQRGKLRDAARRSDDRGARRAGVEQGNTAVKPAGSLAAPTPAKSPATSGSPADLEWKLRVVAAICTITTMATISASGATARKLSNEIAGKAKRGTTAGKAPRVAAPRASRPSPRVSSAGERQRDQRGRRAWT